MIKLTCITGPEILIPEEKIIKVVAKEGYTQILMEAGYRPRGLTMTEDGFYVVGVTESLEYVHQLTDPLIEGDTVEDMAGNLIKSGINYPIRVLRKLL
jgi:hypothetical protein